MAASNREGEQMLGVREYAEDYPVLLKDRNGRPVIDAVNEAGYNGVEIDLLDLIQWIKENRPELLVALEAVTS